MLSHKSISIFCLAWGEEVEKTCKALDHCLSVFPYFDDIIFIKNVDNIFNYNKFMVENLNSTINTDFVLTIQSDGFIINPSLWRDEFLQYDYIGSPWPYHGVCGNGGFSLRSKKFLELSSKLKYSPNHAEHTVCPEDAFLCLEEYNRNYFASNSCRFADIKTALDFSYEHPILQYPNHSKEKSFGFHGKFNL